MRIWLYAGAFWLTFLVEAVVVTVWRGLQKRRLLTCFACNLATNPLLNALLNAAFLFGGKTAYAVTLLIGELAVVVAEAVLYRYALREPWKMCFGVSLAANVISYGTGLLLFH